MQTTLGQLEAAVNGRTDALAVVADARAQLEATMDDHELTVEKLMGQVRALYPKDREKWNAIFPPARASRRAGGDPKGDDEEPASPAA